MNNKVIYTVFIEQTGEQTNENTTFSFYFGTCSIMR